MIFSINSLEDWQVVAQQVIGELEPGVLVLLSGPLGAGKTTLTQTIAKALGVTGRLKSPTFALLRTYQIPNHEPLKRLIHIDAYRLESAQDALSLGLEEIFEEQDAAVLIEWPEQMGEWIKQMKTKKIWIKIHVKEEEKREVEYIVEE